MKKIFVLFFLICTYTNTFAGLFGPSNFEECLLENLKNVSNSDAVNAITAACSLKFQNKNAEQKKGTGVKICKLYWDGWKLVIGEKPNNDYVTVKHSFQGARALDISFPKSMAKYLEIDSEKDLPEITNKTKYGRFFNDNMTKIESYCAFN